LRSVAIKLVLVCQRSPATFVRATQPGPNPITTQFRHWHKKGLPPMTVESRPEHAATPAGGPSVHVIRARKLLIGGAVGGATAAALCLIVFSIGFGVSGLISAALAAAMVLFFYGVGQYVMVLFADAGARTLLAVSMCSYTARVVILGLVLVLYNAYHEAWPTLTPMVIFLTTIIVGGRGFCLFSTENRGLRHRVRAAKRR
jgi:hypothetical protein